MTHPLKPSAFDDFNDFSVGDLCTFTPASDTLAQAIGFPRFARPIDGDFSAQWNDAETRALILANLR